MAGHAYREAEPIDKFVEDIVVAYLSRPDIAAVLAPDEGRDDASQILRELAGVQQRSDGLVSAFADGVISQQQLQAGQARLDRQREALQTRLPAPSGSVLRRLLKTPDVPLLWASLGIDERRQVIRELLTIEVIPARTKEATYLDWRKRILNPDSLRIYWRRKPS
jgi:hypothetical protein